MRKKTHMRECNLKHLGQTENSVGIRIKEHTGYPPVLFFGKLEEWYMPLTGFLQRWFINQIRNPIFLFVEWAQSRLCVGVLSSEFIPRSKLDS